MSSQELQRFVDTLAVTLGRAVALDDLDFRLIAFSSHDGDVDEVRRQAILTRQGPEEARRWALEQGVGRAAGPVRLPPNPGLGMLARVCLPLRAHDFHYGYLWLIDVEQSLTQAELVLAAATAQECAALLHRDRVSEDLADARERELLRDLLSEDLGVRGLAAAEVEGAGAFDASGPVTVLCLGAGTRAADPGRSQISERMADAVAGLPRRSCLRLLRPDHGVLVLSAAALAARPHLARDLAGPDLVVGVGEAVVRLEELAGSWQQARRGMQLAQVLPHLRPVASWKDLGVYVLLSRLSLDELDATWLHPAVTLLLERDPQLVETLELYLDKAGDTRAMASELSLHRASVYYRIERIREITGLDLTDGEQRLVVHLSLKLRRLMGDGTTRFASSPLPA